MKVYDGQVACSKYGQAASLLALRRDLAQARIKEGVGHETTFCFLPRVLPGGEELWG